MPLLQERDGFLVEQENPTVPVPPVFLWNGHPKFFFNKLPQQVRLGPANSPAGPVFPEMLSAIPAKFRMRFDGLDQDIFVKHKMAGGVIP